MPSNAPSKSTSKKPGSQTVLWWVAWICLTILSFFVAVAIWTPVIASRFGPIQNTKAAVLWVTAVFGTWMIILIPLMIVMYHKVDKAYEDARIRREKAASRFRSVLVDKSKRLISPELSKQLQALPETIAGGHLVTAALKDGRRIPHVFIAHRSEILGIYDATELTFEGNDVVTIEAADMAQPPRFLPANWLRVDGISFPE